jgi:hypothetical protein
MDDYEDASRRHMLDAEMLFGSASPRLANASHLFGIAAECALKVVIRKANPSQGFSGSSGHLPKLFTQLENHTSIQSAQIAQVKAAFDGWDISQRYLNQTSKLFDYTVVAKQKSGAKNAQLLMDNVCKGLL